MASPSGEATTVTQQRLDRLEAQMERRLAEVELRNQRYWDNIEARSTADLQNYSALKTATSELEGQFKDISTWRSSIGEKSELLEGVKGALKADLQTLSQGLQELREEHRKAQSELSQGAREELTQLRRQEAEDLEKWKQDLQQAIDDLRQDFTEEWKCSFTERLAWTERRLEDQKDDLTALRELWSGAQEEDRFAAREEELREVFSKFEARLLSLEKDLPTRVRSELESGLQDLLLEKVHGEVKAQLGPATEKALESTAREEIAQLHAERAAMRRAWERVEGLRHDDKWGYFLEEDRDWRQQAQDRLDDLAKTTASLHRQLEQQPQQLQQQQQQQVEQQGSPGSQQQQQGGGGGEGGGSISRSMLAPTDTTELKSVWIEIGRLGGRLAETHQMLDALSYRMESHFKGIARTDIRCLPGGKSEVIKPENDVLPHPVLKIKDQSNQEKSQGAAAAAVQVRRRKDASSSTPTPKAGDVATPAPQDQHQNQQPKHLPQASSSCTDSADCAAGSDAYPQEGRYGDTISDAASQRRPSLDSTAAPFFEASQKCTATTSTPYPSPWHSSSLPKTAPAALHHSHSPWTVVPNPKEFASKDWSGMLAAGLQELEAEDVLNDSDG